MHVLLKNERNTRERISPRSQVTGYRRRQACRYLPKVLLADIARCMR